MQSDYERYDFWHREMAAIKPSDRSMKKLIESNKRFDEKMSNKPSEDRSMKKLIESSKRFDEKMSNKPSEDHRSEDIGAYATSIITNSILLS